MSTEQQPQPQQPQPQQQSQPQNQTQPKKPPTNAEIIKAFGSIAK